MSDDSGQDTQPTGTLVRVSHGSRSTWHHSVRFDGYEHGTACGMAVDTDDIETVIMDIEEFQDVDPRECCEECASSVRAVINDWRGLHEKYEVYEDGDRVEDCFVLEPTSDQAARAALIEYAEETDNEELAQDLRDWVVDICTEDEQLVTDGGEEVGRAISQVTLDGEEIDAERVTCTKYPGCEREAEYVVEVLSYEVGEEIEVKCCGECRDEFAEWVDSEKIREMTRAERWDDGA